jgi:hypothetical protein
MTRQRTIDAHWSVTGGTGRFAGPTGGGAGAATFSSSGSAPSTSDGKLAKGDVAVTS